MDPSQHFDPLSRPALDGVGVLAALNDAQREAVTRTEGPLLVLAGAGSGKTRVITHRIAHLILERGVDPWQIIAVTFTNKAAAEMRERVEALIGGGAHGAWIGTFHAFCLRVLRREGERVGLEPGFNVYDTDDQLALVRKILKDELSDEAQLSPRLVLSRISRAKNALESPSDLEQRAHNPEHRLTARVYERYEEALSRANAADFDDLLLRTVELFRRHADVAEDYATRCRYLLVDEYQDTNHPQYLLVRALSEKHGNICVVGDEDQCIYRFRGAELRNILEFEADHPGACTIRLEQNYRSTRTILAAAGAVVARNLGRKGKTLWTENQQGEMLELFRAPDDRAEAIWVTERVRELEARIPFDQMAVLYRTNAQSRQLEEACRRGRIPYQIVGSVQFYARKEVKDVLAYLKLASNAADDVSFRRVVSTPPRGIGATTLQTLDRVAQGASLSMMQAAAYALDQGLLSGRPGKKLRGFLDLLAELTRLAADETVPELLERVIDSVGYEAYLAKVYAGLDSERMENVRSLISAAVEYTEESEQPTLEGFLDRSALVSDVDAIGQVPGVTLMTVHCAKGLEFPVVFLAGLEEKLFPHVMASETNDDLEEERRLCYVAMTRAKRRLLLSHAHFRRVQGDFQRRAPSRFIAEIPVELIDEVSPLHYGLHEDPAVRWSSADGAEGGSSAALAARRSAGRGASSPPEPVRPGRSEGGFTVGDFVRHPRFGSGRILDLEGSGKHLKLTIHFLNSGPRKILPSYTDLRVERAGSLPE